MPDPDKPSQSTLPRPELNPLLNPVLAANMGRWAEVYFTNPPEKREEAILELLRELESTEGGGAAEASPQAGGTEPKRARTGSVLDAVAVVCASCGHENRNQNLFCGSCGARLPVEAAQVREMFDPVDSEPRAFAGAPEGVSPTLQQIIEESAEAYPDSPVLPPLMPAGGAHEPAWFHATRPQEATEPAKEAMRGGDSSPVSAAAAPVGPLPPARSTPRASQARRDPPRPARPGDASMRPHAWPTARRWQVYAGATLAMVLALLLYSEWRGARAGSGASTSPAGSATAQPDAASSTTPHPGKRPTNRAAKDRSTAVPAPAASTAPAAEQTTAPPVAPATTPVTPAEAPAENGAEELALAERYLNGSHGTDRDSSEAAKWLWKAVAKKNMAATLLLSDLYVRGDGVLRSCDQARLLLEAAAQKGSAPAAARLRSLPDSGCQ